MDMMEQNIYPLFAKVLYFSILEDLDLTKINKLVEKLNFEKAGERSVNDIFNISDVSLDKQIINPLSFLKRLLKKNLRPIKIMSCNIIILILK